MHIGCCTHDSKGETAVVRLSASEAEVHRPDAPPLPPPPRRTPLSLQCHLPACLPLQCVWSSILQHTATTEYVASRSTEHVTADEIVRHVRPEARAAVPDNIKAELLTRIKTFILQL